MQHGGFPSEHLKINLETIGIENFINLILVSEGVRTGMLLQPQDHGEATGADPKTKTILDAMKIEFSDLIYSENYQMYQGIIISKTNYNGQNISLEKMGEILGYPCYKDYETLDRSKITYMLSIIAKMQNGKQFQIFANLCKNNVSHIFEIFCKNANSVFSKEEYTKLFGTVTFNLEIKEIIPPQVIIDKLINNVPITSKDIHAITNIIFNFGFDDTVVEEIMKNIQYINPIHKGILISLLLNNVNDLLVPFYPLQFYPEQKKIITKTMENWGDQVLATLMKTKI